MFFIKKIKDGIIQWSIIVLCGLFSITNVSAKLVFVTEENAINTNSFILNADDSSSDFVDLEFGSVLEAKFRYDILNNKFILNRNLDLSGNEIKNVRLEQLAIAPTCDAGASGRIYFNTTDSHTYSCQNLVWTRLDGASGSGLTINETVQTADYNTLSENTINILSGTSTNRPSDHQYIVKTLGSATLKTQVATRTVGGSQRYYRVLQSGVWADWKQIKTKKYGGYSIQNIDQTDGTASYIGRTRDSDSKWLITKSITGGFTYAQVENNAGTTTFATAWTNRLTLTYGTTFTP